MPELERHGRPELGTARLPLSQGAVNWIMSQPYGDYLTAKHEKVVLANPRKFIYEKLILAYPRKFPLTRYTV